ncbi:hypothetical protein NE237_012230 [Protea cynaroides]|uniref:Uncharacterized protein n=1 Tax=Protea cynaroides TaxID=273540 RepID=A0A9Q0GWH1_9MAGN|nr:hypothetical protein NE237_012230 [Protea cynaroides]
MCLYCLLPILKCFGCNDDVLPGQSTAPSERAAAESRGSSGWRVASHGSPSVTTATPTSFVQAEAHFQRACAETHWSQQRFTGKAFDGTSGQILCNFRGREGEFTEPVTESH